MGRERTKRVDNESIMALNYFRSHTTNNSTVNGILKTCRFRLDLLSRRMMYQLNGEWRKCRMRDELEAKAPKGPVHFLRRRAGIQSRILAQ